MPIRDPTAATIQGPYTLIPNGRRYGTKRPTDPGTVVSKTCNLNLNQGNTTMKMLKLFKNFKNDESGAVTVDWVVLTGAVVALGIIISQTMGGAITTASGNVAADVIANSNNPDAP